mgnify:CR=1 FL=1
MSQDTYPPAQVSATFAAGATFRKGWARTVGGQPDDYTDCTAVAELRDATSNALLGTFVTLGGITGNIAFDGNRIELYMGPAATKALAAFESAIYHVELRRPTGDVERLYEIAFAYSAESTQADPPTP